MKKIKLETGSEFKPLWSADELLARESRIDLNISRNIIGLVDDGATIPFIARYRKAQTGNMDVDQIKNVVSKYQDIKEVEERIESVCKSVSKCGKMNTDLETSICMSTSMEDVDTLYALYKPAPKGSYAERARTAGLEGPAMDILAGRPIQLWKLINPGTKGLESAGEIEKGVGHIIADTVAKDKECFDKLREICYSSNEYTLHSSKVKDSSQGQNKKATSSKQLKSQKVPDKFSQYYSFSTSAKKPLSHVVLALNRGEECKALNVRVNIPKIVKFKFIEFACRKFLKNIRDIWHCNIIKSSIEDAYDRLMEPTLCRQTRSSLTRSAEKEAITVFASNVKCLLLSTPTRNKTIMGVDPGFRNGCKFAVISTMGSVLDTGVIYFHSSFSHQEKNKFVSLVHQHRCEIITIGNGVACRETEMIISDMISSKLFKPLDVVYCITDECGASIYSVSDQAKKDLPDLDPTLRGAVSIARRLIDPLAEFVKIEPQHLGVGMYQHDVSKTKLQKSLDGVVEECVSFVGVDLNTCSECLLRRVSGLNASKAKKIIEWREKNGAFINRHQLLSIKGLGEKGYEQCAGFVRIFHNDKENKVKIEKAEDDIVDENSQILEKSRKRKAETKGKTSKTKKAKLNEPQTWNPLDCTAIHPESYETTYKFLEYAGVKLEDLGSNDFIKKIKAKSLHHYLHSFKDKHDISFATAELICNALMRPITFDLRDGSQKPLFKMGIRSMSDLQFGEIVTGRVSNVTQFGAFVDIGVGVNGLIPSNKIWKEGRPKTGDRVKVKVLNMELQRQRISLFLMDVLEPKLMSKMLY